MLLSKLSILKGSYVAVKRKGIEASKQASNSEEVPEKIFSVGVLLCSIVIVILVFGALFYHYFLGGDIPWFEISNYNSAQYWGQLGDFAGGFLNPILSFLALMAVLRTMALQRAEMRAAQFEAKAANLEQRVQSNLYTKQAFETTFFGMLEVHSRILSDIQLSSNPQCRGRDAVDAMLTHLTGSNTFQISSMCPRELEESVVQGEINQLCRRFRSQTGHYFRNLYWILKKIDGSHVSMESEEHSKGENFRRRRYFFDYLRKREYASLVRAQLSEGELALLQLNCLGPYGGGLKHYVEKYSILKSLEYGFFGGWTDCINAKFHKLAFKSSGEVSLGELDAFITSEKMFRQLRAKTKSVNILSDGKDEVR